MRTLIEINTHCIDTLAHVVTIEAQSNGIFERKCEGS